MTRSASIRVRAVLTASLCIVIFGAVGAAQTLPGPSPFRTDLSKRSIDLGELLSGGPPKDGIPAINQPRFDSVAQAAAWIDDREPVLVFEHGGEARVYPLQILIWHEMANDVVGDLPVLASYCPLCQSAIVFDRRVNDQVLDFGVSGLLRHSDMIMFDRRTESLWQQLTGEAVVGELTGKNLRILPSRQVDFGSVRKYLHGAKVLNRETGVRRDYGKSPYAGYEDGNRTIFPVPYKKRGALRKLDRLATIRVGDKARAYPLKRLGSSRVEAGEIAGTPYIVFFDPAAASALDRSDISGSKRVGSVGVFSPLLDGQALSFKRDKNKIMDEQTGSAWNIFGEAVEGPLQGKRLTAIDHGVFYAFAWLAFHPDTEIVGSR